MVAILEGMPFSHHLSVSSCQRRRDTNYTSYVRTECRFKLEVCETIINNSDPLLNNEEGSHGSESTKCSIQNFKLQAGPWSHCNACFSLLFIGLSCLVFDCVSVLLLVVYSCSSCLQQLFSRQ